MKTRREVGDQIARLIREAIGIQQPFPIWEHSFSETIAPEKMTTVGVKRLNQIVDKLEQLKEIKEMIDGLER